MLRVCDDINRLMDEHKNNGSDELPDYSEYTEAIKLHTWGIMRMYKSEEEREMFDSQNEYFGMIRNAAEDWIYGKINYSDAKAQLNESCTGLDDLYTELSVLLMLEGISIEEIEKVFIDIIDLTKIEIQMLEE